MDINGKYPHQEGYIMPTWIKAVEVYIPTIEETPNNSEEEVKGPEENTKEWKEWMEEERRMEAENKEEKRIKLIVPRLKSPQGQEIPLIINEVKRPITQQRVQARAIVGTMTGEIVNATVNERNECKHGCRICGTYENVHNMYLYCINECKICDNLRKDKVRKETAETRNNNKKIEMIRSNGEERKVMGDHYYWVTLTAKPEDGDDDYIIDQLVKSYGKMFPKCSKPKAYAYVIERTEEGVPHLHGMIRYTGEYAQCPTSPHFRHKIKPQTRKTAEEREKVVVRITEKVGGGGKGGKAIFATKIEGENSITEKWNYMGKEGTVMGRNLFQEERKNQRLELRDFL